MIKKPSLQDAVNVLIGAWELKPDNKKDIECWLKLQITPAMNRLKNMLNQKQKPVFSEEEWKEFRKFASKQINRTF